MRIFNILHFNNLVNVGRRWTFEKKNFFFSRRPSTTLRDQSLFITQRGGVGGVRRISGDHMVSRGNGGGISSRQQNFKGGL